MLKILYGRAGSGKTESIMSEISINRRPGTVLIVPEQYSHDTERKLCTYGGDDISLTAEVLSFSRLCTRVFSEEGGLATEFLDDGGKLLTMCRAINEVRSRLGYYKRPSERAEFLSEMVTAITEFKTYCVRPDELEGVSAALDGSIAAKLKDLSLIYEAYEALEARTKLDSLGRLDMLADILGESEFCDGRDFYIDCFSDFSGLEWRVIEKIILKARSVMVAITCGDESVFELQRETIAKLRTTAGKLGVKVVLLEAKASPDKPAELDYLEKNLFRYEAEAYDEPADAIKLVVAPNRTIEIEWAASKVVELARDKGLRYRDIAVVADSFETYSSQMEDIFEKYGIPLFVSARTDITEKPALSAVTSALSAVTGGFSYDDMFKYLKTGLAGIGFDECDLLENYVLMWNIRGTLWTRQQPWTFNPAGFGADFTEREAENLSKLNSLRETVMRPLMNLNSGLKTAETGADMTLALYEFIDEIKLVESLSVKADMLTELGYLKQAEEYSSVWDVLCGVLEQCHASLYETTLPPEQFSRLFTLTLSAYDVDTIPVSIDCVTAGEINRMRHRQTKCLIVLGATSEAFSTLPSGIISENERSQLIEMGLNLAPPAVTRLEQKLGIIYSLFSSAEKELYISYPETDAAGEEFKPLFIISRLKRILPKIDIIRAGDEAAAAAPLPAVELAAYGEGELADALKHCFSSDERFKSILAAEKRISEHLSRASVQALYGKKPTLSATRADRFNSCKFSYFMQYGLKASAREKADFAAPEYGTFVHYILENVGREVLERGGGFKGFDRAELKALTKKYTGLYIENQLYGGLDDKTERFKYLFKRLEASVYEVVKSAFDELDVSEFQPVEMEATFGDGARFPVIEAGFGDEAVKVGGVVDRIDAYEKNGKLYLRVIDYKTGVKAFNYTDVRYGMGIQMLLYLFALVKDGFEDRKAVPAGVLYFPARDPVLSAPRDISDEELQKERLKSLKRQGLLIDDGEILRAMEDFGDEKPSYLPIEVNKDGSIRSKNIASLEQLGKLSRHVDSVLAKIGKELAGGEFIPDPYTHGTKSACDYCDFSSACGFDQQSSKKRYLKTYNQVDFWTWMEEGQADERI